MMETITIRIALALLAVSCWGCGLQRVSSPPQEAPIRPEAVAVSGEGYYGVSGTFSIVAVDSCGSAPGAGQYLTEQFQLPTSGFR